MARVNFMGSDPRTAQEDSDTVTCRWFGRGSYGLGFRGSQGGDPKTRPMCFGRSLKWIRWVQVWFIYQTWVPNPCLGICLGGIRGNKYLLVVVFLPSLFFFCAESKSEAQAALNTSRLN